MAFIGVCASKNISAPLLYNGHFGSKTWHPQRKNFFREASHFTTDINCPKRRYRQKKILAPVSQLTFFFGVPGITHKKSSYFTTDNLRRLFNTRRENIFKQRTSPSTFQRTFSWQMRGIRPEKNLIIPNFATDRI